MRADPRGDGLQVVRQPQRGAASVAPVRLAMSWFQAPMNTLAWASRRWYSASSSFNGGQRR